MRSTTLLSLAAALTAGSLLAQPGMLRDIRPGATSSMTSGGPFLAIGKTVLFPANGSASRYPQLWRTDGSTAGTSIVRTGVSVRTEFGKTTMLLAGKTLYFIGHTGSMGAELWKSDGTTGGTGLVKQIRSGSQDGARLIIGHMNGEVYFWGLGPGLTSGLWKSDGTAAGTVFLKQMTLQFSRSARAYKGHFYFSGLTPQTGYEMFRTDGTPNGTVLFREFVPGRNNGFVPGDRGLTVFKGELFFTPFIGRERHLWKTDGTAAGTVSVDRANKITIMGAAGSTLLVNRSLLNQAGELWGTDGAGKLRRISGVLPGFMANISGGRAVFRTLRGQLYVTDATSAGTKLLLPTHLGSAQTNPEPIGNGDLVAFQGRDRFGTELWVTDGTAQRTRRMTDLNPAAGNSGPFGFVTSSDNVYFTASNGKNGIEPWAASLKWLGGTLIEPYGTGCTGTKGNPVLGANGAPKIGNTSFAIELTKARPKAVALVGLSHSSVSFPLQGCTLLIALTQPVVLEGHLTTASCDLNLPLPIPNAVSLVGLDFFMQAFVLDPNGKFQSRIAFSNGLRVLVGL